MDTNPPEGPAPPAGRAALAHRLRERLGPVPERAEWPPVSVVVVNRDGEEHLRRLLPLLASATDYPQLELILVDNASADGSVEFARAAELPFPLTVLRNEENLSFSDANNDGVEAARFDLLLLLNNDVEPFEPGWLKELVECLERSGVAAVGATLLHGGASRNLPGGVYAIQHRRVELIADAGFLRPVNAGDGEELRGPASDVPAIASTAACMLVRRDAFERVGGFATGYRWGWEDVDLGLALSCAGDQTIGSGRSVLVHHESSTRSSAGHEWQRRTRSHNRRLFARRWGPQARREYLLDRLSGRGLWTDGRAPLLAIVLAGRERGDREARELADAIEELGWRASLVEPAAGRGGLPADADFILLTDPSFGASLPAAAPCIAWIRDDAGAWLDAPLLRRVELTLASSLSLERDLEAAGVAPVLFSGAGDAAHLIRLLGERVQRLRFCLRLSRDWDLEPGMLALRRSLERLDHACAVELADEWDSLCGLTADVAVACEGPAALPPSPAQLNVLWAGSEIAATRCDPWDLVLVADPEAAATLGAGTPTPVAALDLSSAADAAERLLELVARAAASEGVVARVAAQA